MKIFKDIGFNYSFFNKYGKYFASIHCEANWKHLSMPYSMNPKAMKQAMVVHS